MRLHSLFLSFVALILLAACGQKSSKPTLTVSIPPQQYFLERLVGDKYDVQCLLGQGSNPESYEPEMSQLIALEKSNIYFCLGNIGFEQSVLSRVKENMSNLNVVDCSTGINLLKGTHSGMGHSHSHHCNHEVDPHIWTSVVNAMIIVDNMYQSLIASDKTNAEFYTNNYNALKAELSALNNELSQLLESKMGVAFAVWHPSLSYFARDYSLKQIAMEIEGKEIPANKLKEGIEYAQNQGVKVIFFQKEFDNRQVMNINDALNAKMVEINLMSYNWTNELRNIAYAIASE